MSPASSSRGPTRSRTPSQPACRRRPALRADVHDPCAGRTIDTVLALGAGRGAHARGAGPLERRAHVPGPARVADVHTLRRLLAARASATRWSTRFPPACETRCRSCAGISWIRNELVRKSPPGRLAVSQAIADEDQYTSGGFRLCAGWSHNPVEAAAVSPTWRGPPADVRIPRAARRGQGSPHPPRRVRPGRPPRVWLVFVGRRPSWQCGTRDPGSSRRAGWTGSARRRCSTTSTVSSCRRSASTRRPWSSTKRGDGGSRLIRRRDRRHPRAARAG